MPKTKQSCIFVYMNNTLLEAVESRHSVRSYTSQKIEGETLAKLQSEVDRCNKGEVGGMTMTEERHLHIQLAIDEPEAFNARIAHYGNFINVRNYIVLCGKASKDLDRMCGYCGEHLVLTAQTLGLNTCWVGMNYGKSKVKCTLEPGEKVALVIALGYGAVEGHAHKSKTFEQVTDLSRWHEAIPDWFKAGVECALKAPTAMDQQNFIFALNSPAQPTVTLNSGPFLRSKDFGSFENVDLGIVKYNFELASGQKVSW